MPMGEAPDAPMAGAAGSSAQDPTARIAAALDMLPSRQDGQAALVSNIEVLMRSVEKEREEMSALSARISDL